MKIENTLENKARFYGNHIGCEIYRGSMSKNSVLTFSSFSGVIRITDMPLHLAPLSLITDEDALNICRLVNSHFSDDSIAIVMGRRVVQNDSVALTPNEWLRVHDYLRSKGYALPFMGLSVDDLVSYGWVKLKEA